jgi:hypothetical protein
MDECEEQASSRIVAAHGWFAEQTPMQRTLQEGVNPQRVGTTSAIGYEEIVSKVRRRP